MSKEVISSKQGISIMILFIIGSTLVVGMGNEAKQDSWIAIILATLVAIPVAFIYSRITNIYSNKNLFHVLEEVFGQFIGKFVSFLYVCFFIHLGSLVFRNLSEFTNIVVFPDTPKEIPLIPMIVLCTWGVKEGIEVIGRLSHVALICILFVVIFGTFIISIPKMDAYNLLPIMPNGIKPVITASISIFCFPLSEVVIFTAVFSSLKSETNRFRVYLIGLLMGSGVILTSTLKNILILGAEGSTNKYFASYNANSLITIGSAFERLELAISLIFLITGFVKISICILAACKGTAKIFNLDDYKFLSTPMVLLMFSISIIIYENTMEMVEWAFKIWPYYSVIFELIFPCITLVIAEFRNGVFKTKLKGL